MAERVTIQDIADALGLSRNTVSKAINNTGSIAESTRNAVLKKAAELGYKQFSFLQLPSDAGSSSETDSEGKENPSLYMGPGDGPSEIAFLTTGQMDLFHFGSSMLDRICQEMDYLGYHVAIYRLLPSDIEALRLPPGIQPDRTAGIICAELLDRDYCRMAAGLEYPILFVDFPCYLDELLPRADILLMDNESVMYDFVRNMKAKGLSKFGFMGDIFHCRSFFERFHNLRGALEIHGIPFDPSLSLTMRLDNIRETCKDYESYLDYLTEELRSRPVLPEVFVCANDFNAIDLMRALSMLDIRMPDDILVMGFDDSSESRIITPSLSTVHIHSQTMGHVAVRMLLSRIKEPNLYYRIVHTETTLILRDSTRR